MPRDCSSLPIRDGVETTIYNHPYYTDCVLLLIISFKKEYKKKDLVIEVDKFYDILTNDMAVNDMLYDLESIWDCFEFSHSPFKTKKNIHLDMESKFFLILTIFITISLIIINLFNLY